MLLLVSRAGRSHPALPCPSCPGGTSSWLLPALATVDKNSSALSLAPCFAPALLRLIPNETLEIGGI